MSRRRITLGPTGDLFETNIPKLLEIYTSHLLWGHVRVPIKLIMFGLVYVSQCRVIKGCPIEGQPGVF